jgi:hypothetical protein
VFGLKRLLDELEVEAPFEMVFELVGVGEVETPRGADPGEEMDLKFVVGALIGTKKAMVRFKLELPERIEADEEVREEGDPLVGEGRFKEF